MLVIVKADRYNKGKSVTEAEYESIPNEHGKWRWLSALTFVAVHHHRRSISFYWN